jgi:hypothetical protein
MFSGMRSSYWYSRAAAVMQQPVGAVAVADAGVQAGAVEHAITIDGSSQHPCF